MGIEDFVIINAVAAVLLLIGVAASFAITKNRSRSIRIAGLAGVILVIGVAYVWVMIADHRESDRLLKELRSFDKNRQAEQKY